MGRILTGIVRDRSWFAFNWLHALFALQYFAAQRFAPTRWLALRADCTAWAPAACCA